MRDEDAEVPRFSEDLLVLPDHLAFAVFLVLGPSPDKLGAIRRSESALTVLQVLFPLPLVFVTLSREELALAVALACLPVAHVEILIIVVALAEAFAEALSPCSVVLVVCALLLVGAVEHALTVAFVIEDLSLVEITIEIRYLGDLSKLRSLCLIEAHLACAKACRASRQSCRIHRLPVLHVVLLQLPQIVGIIQRLPGEAVVEAR